MGRDQPGHFAGKGHQGDGQEAKGEEEGSAIKLEEAHFFV